MCTTVTVCVHAFGLNHCGCVLQEKPARPPCGITTPGCISMTTPQKESLPSLSRTSSTPCSPMRASSSCSGTRWKGESNFCFAASYYCISALKCNNNADTALTCTPPPLCLYQSCLHCRYRQILFLFIANKRPAVTEDALPFTQSGCHVSL